MLNRVSVSLMLALLGVFATTGISYAASDDREEVIFGTAIVAVCLMALLFVIYLVKHALGLDKMPPPPADDGAHGHH